MAGTSGREISCCCTSGAMHSDWLFGKFLHFAVTQAGTLEGWIESSITGDAHFRRTTSCGSSADEQL